MEMRVPVPENETHIVAMTSHRWISRILYKSLIVAVLPNSALFKSRPTAIFCFYMAF